MNLRLLALLLLSWIAWLLLRKHLQAWQQQREQGRADAARKVTRMVPCSYCQLHLPEEEAISADGEWFCSAKHRQAWLKGP